MDKNPIVLREEKILEFWKDKDIFKKSEAGISAETFFERMKEKHFGKKEFVFYDGPPFATGTPHVGHILVGTVKDVIPRYKTMNGYKVIRKWGWDCHGLPLEVEIEKKLGIKNKKEIEEYGIEKFNQAARDAVFTYAEEWKKLVPRFGRWIDMENDYRTLSSSYIESVWNVFNRIYERGYVKNGFKSLLLCPRCSTTLSNNEVAEGYEMLTDTAVYVTFPLKDKEDVNLVAWTTTPWTLFGNVALAVNKDFDYVYVKKDSSTYVVLKEQRELIEGGEVIQTVKGSELVGKEYKPLFKDNFLKESSEGNEYSKTIWRVYDADYIEKDVGTGIIHLAPAYGEVDLVLAKKESLPIKHHVSLYGTFVDELGEFAGLEPKKTGNPDDVDKKILSKLEEKGRLLKSERIEHSYPTCWRCTTPLLNYATNSWYIDVPQFLDKVKSENKKINWVPKHFRDGRFGKWIEASPIWNVSRTRFWGAPLPIWENKESKELIVINSIEDMFSKMKTKNNYYFVRHTESLNNKEGFFNCLPNDKIALTKKGEAQAVRLAKEISKLKPTVMFSSPLKRTMQTAEFIKKETGLEIKEAKELIDKQVPEFEGVPIEQYFKAVRERNFSKGIDRETSIDVCNRILEFLERIEKEYEGETIVFVTHKSSIHASTLIGTGEMFTENAVIRENINFKQKSFYKLRFFSLKRRDGEVDLHRPYIDDIVLYDERDRPYYNIKEVFDCWFESGSMPYGSNHYPFEKNGFDPLSNKGFPADFICEAVDQTRGWFNSLLKVSVAAFDKAAYKNVIATGLVRAVDGKKLSKKLKNYTDPAILVEKFGADALRHFLISSPVVQGQDIDFKDEFLLEIQRKFYVRLDNCFKFYALYRGLPHKSGSKNTLDKYILARLEEVRSNASKYFEEYKLDSATKPFMDFVDDFSTWYLRRSRDVLKEDSLEGAYARQTMKDVLITFSKVLAPLSPFYADYLYKEMVDGLEGFPESVHLSRWPKKMKFDQSVLRKMKDIRLISSLAHEARERSGIKVRQPLASVTISKVYSFNKEEEQLILKEVNIKKVIYSNLKKDEVVLDTELTEELKNEGFMRELTRLVQSLRKEKNYSADEYISELEIVSDSDVSQVISNDLEAFKKSVRASDVKFKIEELSDEFSLKDKKVKVNILS